VDCPGGVVYVMGVSVDKRNFERREPREEYAVVNLSRPSVPSILKILEPPLKFVRTLISTLSIRLA
jgi:hypothetical protein